jgi:hypothetical protein
MPMNLMLLGAITMACFTITLFFLRFWKTTRDRFFLYFAISFGMEGSNRIMLGLIDYSNEQEPLFYVLRLIAFLLIIWAVIDKNWLKANGN